jgi:uncharacterized protein YqfB (UPF0267 family)
MEYKLPKNNPKAYAPCPSTNIDSTFAAEIAIELWRLKQTLVHELPNSVDPQPMKTWKIMERLFSRLNAKDITIQDKTGEPYDPGMALRVVSAEPRAELLCPLIVETITPTVFHRGNIIHIGEVIVGKPAITSP